MAQGTVQARVISPKTSVIDIVGYFTSAAESSTDGGRHRCQLADHTHGHPELHRSGVHDSAGIGSPVTFLIRTNRQKQRVVAYGLSEHYRHIFELTRLSR